MGSAMEQQKSVIIVGAGACGLLIAHGLQRANIPFTLFEAEAQDAVRRDWGLSLHWGRPLLKDLLPKELFDNLRSTQVNPFYETPENEHLPIINGQSGELITRLEFGCNHRISRKRFRELCARMVPIQHGKVLVKVEVGVDEKVTVHFSDGTDATGDILVGCDGARSKVRDFLLGADKARVKTLPYEAYFANPRYSADVALKMCELHPIHTTAIHPDGMFCWLGPLHVPDPEKPETWQFVLAISGPKDEAGYGSEARTSDKQDRLALLKGNAARFAEPYRTALSLLKDDEPVWYIDLSHWETVPWNNQDGRVTLAGDAAHPMTFHRGQGLNNAILDALKFVSAITGVNQGKETPPEAVSRYEAEMQERGREEVLSSYKNTQMLLDWDAFRKSPLFTAGLKREQQG